MQFVDHKAGLPKMQTLIRVKMNEASYEYHFGGGDLINELYENGWLEIQWLDINDDQEVYTREQVITMLASVYELTFRNMDQLTLFRTCKDSMERQAFNKALAYLLPPKPVLTAETKK